MWNLIDHSGPSMGYLRLTYDDKRVADFFPFASGADPEWVRDQAKKIVDTMNASEAPQRSL